MSRTLLRGFLEAQDGLQLNVSVEVIDPEGHADLVADDIMAMFDNYIEDQDADTASFDEETPYSREDVVARLKDALRERGLQVR